MRFVNDDRVIDTENKRTMQVICAGLPRCATSSLQAALESEYIGLDPCMHMAHVIPHPDRAELCIDAELEPEYERRMKIVQRLFDGYAATADFPGMIFTDELMDLYPDAKIVLNQRENGKVWAESITGSINWFKSWQYLALCCFWQLHRQHWRTHQATKKLAMVKFGKPLTFDEDGYYFFNDWVRAEAKKRGREVLEWEASDGWEPLCKYLGKDAPPPGTPFPHVNDQATMRNLRYIFIAQGTVSWIALGASVWAGWNYGPGLVAKAVPFIKGYLFK